MHQLLLPKGGAKNPGRKHVQILAVSYGPDTPAKRQALPELRLIGQKVSGFFGGGVRTLCNHQHITAGLPAGMRHGNLVSARLVNTRKGHEMNPQKKLPANERKLAIVKAATHLFSERGFRGVTTRELAKACGVSEPVLYEHFADKRQLYAAILEQTAAENPSITRRIDEAFASNLAAPQFLHLIADTIVRFLDRNHNYSRLVLFSALEGHELAQLNFEHHMKPFHTMLVKRLQADIDAGTLRACDAVSAARVFLGMLNQYFVYDLHFGFSLSKASRKKAIKGMVEIFLHGITK